MITLSQADHAFGEAPAGAASTLSDAPAAGRQARDGSRITTQILHAALFLTILISGIVFIEPAPYEFAVAVLGLACLLAGVTFDRKLLPLLLLLLIWNIGGFISFFQVINEPKTGRFVAVSAFMALSTLVFACLFAQDTVRRLAVLRSSYLVAAILAAVTGLMGYFNVLGTGELFAPIGRAAGTFKDPNVYGPFLILPILLLLQSLLLRGVGPLRLVLFLFLSFGLFLSFSRGAWMHLLLSGAVMMALMFVTAQSNRMRLRLIVLAGIGLAALALGILAILSIDTIGEMFKERAKIVQYYDVGNRGRFSLQLLGVEMMLKYPLGMGPYEFARVFSLQQHNVYLQAFIVYSWIGGFAYLALIVTTLVTGLRTALVVAPWQPFAIAVFATFIGVVGEGIIIDTDHWRHFFLLLGLIWGLSVASANLRAQEVPARH